MSRYLRVSVRGRELPCMQALLASSLLVAGRAQAQTDYYNTDAGRPLTIEDAYPVERRAIELQLAPLRFERSRPGIYQWQVEPEVAFGILPRTQIELGLPFTYIDRGVLPHERGLAGIELSALYNFNTETRIPAFAIAGDVVAPVGPLASDHLRFSLAGIMTRTFPAARFHVNARYTIGEQDSSKRGHADSDTRWLAGVAIDRVFPLNAFLLGAEIVARQPYGRGSPVSWQGGAGMRYQLTPRIASDIGAGYRSAPGNGAWYFTIGSAIAVGLPWRP